MKKKDWKTYYCKHSGCKRYRYHKRLKLCFKHYQKLYLKNRDAFKEGKAKSIKEAKSYAVATHRQEFKHDAKHYRDLKRFKTKYKYVSECILLVKWQQEYDEADEKKRKIIEARKRYIIKSKYNKLSPDLLSNFDNSSDINCQVVKDYKDHIKYLEAFDWRTRTVLKGRNKMKYLSQMKKKEEEENDEQI
tara:strand:+ start:950 stop:1519 length:570 start_codon:yes stop_codon:yes gene_type:complete